MQDTRRAAPAEEGRRQLLATGQWQQFVNFQLPCPRTPTLTLRCLVYCGRFGGNHEAYD